MALDNTKKGLRDDLVTDLETQIIDKQNLVERLTHANDESIAVAQKELDILILKRDGLKGLK